MSSRFTVSGERSKNCGWVSVVGMSLDPDAKLCGMYGAAGDPGAKLCGMYVASGMCISTFMNSSFACAWVFLGVSSFTASS